MSEEPETPVAAAGDQTGPEFDPAGDFEYDEAHGAGHHQDIPATLEEEAERRRTLAAPR
ncbi:hypothetical protein ACWT_5158 [Actinoplanes sp. SE50]|uniref:hypothetical protein n=1 Tax=unclassified Actinoplanes TaxID=2626549 RepID=UPI00023ED4A0|nr:MULTISPECIES: hypothetical protein [unclassified Actinoplanes]AEV86175.1 hypothetical protein ACPL_5288 [Actinoplanes sp. SE50/110]ATO84573.1 hypothetical protein ACWT_5158 [Actinoplanes sp. SE50]SLM01983.1 hypothetical protein ACSP50_5221 [Actinoplanes sp. SE50/110]